MNANSVYNSTVGGLLNQIISGPLRWSSVCRTASIGASAGLFPTGTFNSTTTSPTSMSCRTATPAAPTVVATTPRAQQDGRRRESAAHRVVLALDGPVDDHRHHVQRAAHGTSGGTDAGGAVDGTVTYDDATNTASLDPSAPLTHGVTYQSTLTTAIRARDGMPLATATTWSFTVAAPPPPLAVSASPAAGATSVNVDTAVKLMFNRAIRCRSR